MGEFPSLDCFVLYSLQDMATILCITIPWKHSFFGRLIIEVRFYTNKICPLIHNKRSKFEVCIVNLQIILSLKKARAIYTVLDFIDYTLLDMTFISVEFGCTLKQ